MNPPATSSEAARSPALSADRIPAGQSTSDSISVLPAKDTVEKVKSSGKHNMPSSGKARAPDVGPKKKPKPTSKRPRREKPPAVEPLLPSLPSPILEESSREAPYLILDGDEPHEPVSPSSIPLSTPSIRLNAAATQSSPASAHSNPESGRAVESSASEPEAPRSPPRKKTEKRKHTFPPRPVAPQGDFCHFLMAPFQCFDPYIWQSFYDRYQPDQAKRPQLTPDPPLAAPSMDLHRSHTMAPGTAALSLSPRPIASSEPAARLATVLSVPISHPTPAPDPIPSRDHFETLPTQRHQAPPTEGLAQSDYPSSPGSPASTEPQHSKSSHEPELPPPPPDMRGSHTSSSSDDFSSYTHLVFQMAQALNLNAEQPPPVDVDPVFDDIDQERVAPLSLPFNKSILRLIKDTWGKTPSTMQISRRTDGLYRTYGVEAEFLTRHPVPNSIIVESSQARAHAKAKPILPIRTAKSWTRCPNESTPCKPFCFRASATKQPWVLSSVISGTKSFHC
ncbi:12S rRNA N(4)-cytidine methyltransferase METTL15 isoform X2 [Pogona vitticeps]